MISSLRKYNFLIILGAFCLIYNPPILPFNTMHLVGLLSIVYLLMHYSQTLRILSGKSVFNNIIFFTAILLYLILVALISKTGELSIAVIPIYFLLDIIPFGIALGIYMRKHAIVVYDFINLLLFVCLIQTVMMALAFFSPEIKEWFISRVLAYGYIEVYETLAEHRMFGFASGLTYATPALQSFMAIVMFAMFQKRKYSYVILSLSVFFFAFINARLSVIVLMVGLIVFILLSKASVKNKIGALLLIGVIAYVFITVLLPGLEKNNYLTYDWLMSGMREIELFMSGDIDGYFAYLSSHERYELPKTFFSLVFGQGHNIMGGESAYGVASDIGYINDIWRGGIVYMTALYTFIMKQFWTLYKYNNKTVSFIGVFALVLFPILNIKGTAYSMNNITVALFLIVIVCAVIKPQGD